MLCCAAKHCRAYHKNFGDLFMKNLVLCFVFLFSLSSFADAFGPGTRLEFGIDWERIERGLKSGDFSCTGNCVEVRFDWEEVWKTITFKKYRDKRKQRLAYCISEYHRNKKALVEINSLISAGEITDSEATIMMQMNRTALASVDLLCNEYFGEKKALNLKKSIFENP